jgi:hypothetical protein
MRTCVAIIGLPLFFVMLALNSACKFCFGIDCLQSFTSTFEDLGDTVFWCGVVTLCYFVAKVFIFIYGEIM